MLAIRTLALSAGLALALFAIPVRAADVDPAAIAAASTPAQHEALAKQYQELAAQARAQAKKHASMEARYAPGKADAMRRHCGNLVKTYDIQANEYDALAAMHQAAAKP